MMKTVLPKLLLSIFRKCADTINRTQDVPIEYERTIKQKKVQHNFKEEITAETFIVNRVELINKVESVSKVGNTARVAAEQKNSSSESFEQMLALEQSRQKARVRRADERPVNVNPDVLNGRMNGYNNKAREAYFSMVFPTMDLKG